MQEEQFNKRISQLQETIASRDKVIVDLKNTILGYVEVVFNYSLSNVSIFNVWFFYIKLFLSNRNTKINLTTCH